MIYIGIDPGLSVAICVLENGKPGFYEIDELVLVLSNYSMAEKKVAIERQGIRPNQAGMGKMMRNYGRLLGIMEAFGVEPIEVQPQIWYKHFKIKAGMKTPERKRTTALLMEVLYSESKPLWYGPKGGLIDGRSDALAIASWLRGTQC